MGEAAGDLVSIEQLNENGLVPTGDENPFATGTYATGNKVRGIRNYAANWPQTGAFPTPGVESAGRSAELQRRRLRPHRARGARRRRDLGRDQLRAAPARWPRSTTRSSPRATAALQAQCAAGALPVDAVPGQPALDPAAVRRVPAHADEPVDGGRAQRDPRGRPGPLRRRRTRTSCGRRSPAAASAGSPRRTTPRAACAASSPTRTRCRTSRPRASRNATVTFEATAAGGGGQAAPKARIYVGHYEARVSPIADTDAATNAPATATANNLDADRGVRAGHVRVHRDGPGLRRGALPRDVPGRPPPDGQDPDGAEPGVVGGGRDGDRQRRAGRVRHDRGPAGDAGAEEPHRRHGGHRLAGRRDPGRRRRVERRRQPGDGRPRGHDPAARQPRPGVGDARAGVRRGARTSRRTGSRRRGSSRSGRATPRCPTARRTAPTSGRSPARSNAFPSDAPRPVAPSLLLRTFTFSAVQATHLRIVVRSSQCTDGPAFQGEQDADPFNATDCNSAGPAATRFVRVAELQAYGTDSRVQ